MPKELSTPTEYNKRLTTPKPEQVLEFTQNTPNKDVLTKIEISSPFNADVSFSPTKVDIIFTQPLQFISLNESQEDWEQGEQFIEKMNEISKLPFNAKGFSDYVPGSEPLIDFDTLNPDGGKRYHVRNFNGFKVRSEFRISVNKTGVYLDNINFSLKNLTEQSERLFLENIANEAQNISDHIGGFIQEMLNQKPSTILKSDNYSKFISTISDQLKSHVFNKLKEVYMNEAKAEINEQELYKTRQAEKEIDLSTNDLKKSLPNNIFQEPQIDIVGHLNTKLEMIISEEKQVNISQLIEYISQNPSTCAVEFIPANEGSIFKITMNGTSFLLKGSTGGKEEKLFKPLYQLANVDDITINKFEEMIKTDSNFHKTALLHLLTEIYAQKIGYDITQNELDNYSNKVKFPPILTMYDNNGLPVGFLRPYEEGNNLTYLEATNQLKIDGINLSKELNEKGISIDTFEHSHNFFVTPGGRLSIIDVSLAKDLENQLLSALSSLPLLG
jgi:hypothetical protein